MRLACYVILPCRMISHSMHVWGRPYLVVLFAVVAILFNITVVDAINSYLVIALPFIARVTSYYYWSMIELCLAIAIHCARCWRSPWVHLRSRAQALLEMFHAMRGTGNQREKRASTAYILQDCRTVRRSNNDWAATIDRAQGNNTRES